MISFYDSYENPSSLKTHGSIVNGVKIKSKCFPSILINDTKTLTMLNNFRTFIYYKLTIKFVFRK